VEFNKLHIRINMKYNMILFYMNNIFIISLVISIIFLIFKFLEMRFIDKENKPVKFLIRDTLIVYVCVTVGNLLLQQLEPILETSILNATPSAFTDNPNF
jgi:hypothetical protein